MDTEDRSQLLTSGFVHLYGRRQSERLLPVWTEPGSRSSERTFQPGSIAEAEVDGGARLVRDRDRRVLVQGSGESGSCHDWNGSLFHAGGVISGEGRHVHQYRTADSVAR